MQKDNKDPFAGYYDDEQEVNEAKADPFAGYYDDEQETDEVKADPFAGYYDDEEENLGNDTLNEKREQFSELESAGMGAIQGVTFGFADEMAGAWDWATSMGNKSYEESRDEYRRNFQLAEQDNPASFLAGDIAGGFIVPIPGMGGAKLALKSGKIWQGLTTGAKASVKGGILGGAIEATGRTNESLTSMEGLQDVAIGATVGGALGGASNVISSKLTRKQQENVKKYMDFADELRYDRLYKTTKRSVDEFKDPKKLEKKIGNLKFAKEEGFFKNEKITNVGDLEKYAEKAQKIKKDAGKKMGNVADSIDGFANSKKMSEINFNIKELTNDSLKQAHNNIIQKASKSYVTDGTGLEKTIVQESKKQFDNIQKRLLGSEPVLDKNTGEVIKWVTNSKTKVSPLVAIHEAKKSLRDRIKNFEKSGDKDAPKSAQALRLISDELMKLENQTIKNYKTAIINKFGPKGKALSIYKKLDTYTNLKRRFGKAAELEDDFIKTSIRKTGYDNINVNPSVMSQISSVLTISDLRTRGQYLLAKLIDGSNDSKTFKTASKFFNVTEKELKRYIEGYRSVTTTAPAVELFNEDD